MSPDFVVLRGARGGVAADGAGIGALPLFLSDDERLECVLPTWPLAPVQLNALFASRRGATPKVRASLDFLASGVPGMLREK
jgi:DNA-binding transcriptional LysR family regulator